MVRGNGGGCILKLLKENRILTDCFLVDDVYTDNSKKVKDGVKITSKEKLDPPFDEKRDAIIWAIASPKRIREVKDVEEEYFMIWDNGFWDDKEYYTDKQEEYEKAKNMLSDTSSKEVMDAFVKAQNGDITDDLKLCIEGTYFNDVTKGKREGGFIDCGSYDGESAIAYWNFIGKKCMVYAFEPDPYNFENMKIKFKDENMVKLINKGCWSSTTTLSFSVNGDMSSSLDEEGDQKVDVTTIDEVVGDSKIAFIKMDIEGAELEALKGAKKTINRDMPILAISAYHKKEDFVTLIPYLHSIKNANKHYQLFLLHHGCTSTELVLYGIPCQD